MSRKYVSNRLSLTIKRREVLGFIGSAATMTLLGCQRESRSTASAEPAPQTVAAAESAADLPACVVSPQQTEGPYFVEEALNRSDIRSDPAEGTVKPGVPLRLKLRVSQVSSGACIPLEGAVVDLWHCDAEGVYFKVRNSTAPQGYEFTSQLYFDDALSDLIHAQAPYSR